MAMRASTSASQQCHERITEAEAEGRLETVVALMSSRKLMPVFAASGLLRANACLQADRTAPTLYGAILSQPSDMRVRASRWLPAVQRCPSDWLRADHRLSREDMFRHRPLS